MTTSHAEVSGRRRGLANEKGVPRVSRHVERHPRMSLAHRSCGEGAYPSSLGSRKHPMVSLVLSVRYGDARKNGFLYGRRGINCFASSRFEEYNGSSHVDPSRSC